MAIQIRRGTNTQWESTKSNIIVGEPAVAYDEERAFIGTGSGTFMELANLGVTADEFDATATYAKGDLCTHYGKLYMANSAVSASAWDGSKWDEVTVADVLALKLDAADVPVPATATPQMDGTAAVGSSAKYARENHVHPTDTSRLAKSTFDALGLSVVNGAICVTYTQ